MDALDALDRRIVNAMQGGFPICERPFEAMALQLQTSEQELVTRIERLLEQGTLSRFGPMYHAERMGGSLSLAAMRIPQADFERVAAIVNAMPEVAHNYERSHSLNMWFVLATETPQQQHEAIAQIERRTGYPVHNMPKITEYFVELKLTV